MGTKTGFDVNTEFGSNLEAKGTHTDSIPATLHTTVPGEILEIDISAALTDLQAGDYVGINVTDRNTVGDDNFQLLGVKIKHAKG